MNKFQLLYVLMLWITFLVLIGFGISPLTPLGLALQIVVPFVTTFWAYNTFPDVLT